MKHQIPLKVRNKFARPVETTGLQNKKIASFETRANSVASNDTSEYLLSKQLKSFLPGRAAQQHSESQNESTFHKSVSKENEDDEAAKMDKPRGVGVRSREHKSMYMKLGSKNESMFQVNRSI